jgi:bacterioferritin
MFGNWGLKKLEEHEKKESIDEMKHADRLIERILFLKQEQAAHPLFKEAIAYCEQCADFVSRELQSHTGGAPS